MDVLPRDGMRVLLRPLVASFVLIHGGSTNTQSSFRAAAFGSVAITQRRPDTVVTILHFPSSSLEQRPQAQNSEARVRAVGR